MASESLSNRCKTKTLNWLTGHWCNGNTSLFGGEFVGSNPACPTAIRLNNLGRLDALNGRPKDYTSMDIRTPEYPQIFDFMTLGLFVVDLTPICEGITVFGCLIY